MYATMEQEVMKMKPKVIEDACIGCGACEHIAPKYFELNEDGISTVKQETVADEDRQDVQDAASSCPTGAIEVEEA